MTGEVTFVPIGVVRSPFADRVSAPRQPSASREAAGTIELFPGRDFEHALSDLDGWERIWVVFCFHLNPPGAWRPKVLPPRSAGKRRGVFSTRSPHRPNPIGLSVVRLSAVRGLVLHVRDVDMVDGTPVLDLKPYVPYADAFPASRTGWLSPLLPADPGVPVDPEPGFAVAWAPLAAEQAAWLRSEHGVDLEDPVRRVLELGPQPHPYRRIKAEGDGFRLAVKDWRIRFRVDGRAVTVEAIRSGYRPAQLAAPATPEVVVQRALRRAVRGHLALTGADTRWTHPAAFPGPWDGRGPMKHALLAGLLGIGIAACSSKGGSAGGAGAGSTGVGGSIPAPPPPDTCTPPASLADVSKPTTVVGSGEGTCTEALLDAAVAKGGTVTFDCGASATITVKAPITVAKDTVIDGGGTVTVSGGGATRIFITQGDVSFTVQRITLSDGLLTGAAADVLSSKNSGAAIYRQSNGTLVVVDATFKNNHAAAVGGSDVGGGAIYSWGGDTIVVGSTFDGNTGAQGGAIGNLRSNLTVVNSTFVNNQATAANGGAIATDGQNADHGKVMTLCGVIADNNVAAMEAGAVYRYGYPGESTVIDSSTFDGNTASDPKGGLGGALYHHTDTPGAMPLTLTNSTISNNTAGWGGGAMFWYNSPVTMINVTVAGNKAVNSLGGGIAANGVTGTIESSTIADNHADNGGSFGGGLVGGASLTLTNTILSGNTAGNEWNPVSCTDTASGDHDLQYPPKEASGQADKPCVGGVTMADPLLGPLQDNGGPTKTMALMPGSPAIGAGSGCYPRPASGARRGRTPATSAPTSTRRRRRPLTQPSSGSSSRRRGAQSRAPPTQRSRHDPRRRADDRGHDEHRPLQWIPRGADHPRHVNQQNERADHDRLERRAETRHDPQEDRHPRGDVPHTRQVRPAEREGEPPGHRFGRPRRVEEVVETEQRRGQRIQRPSHPYRAASAKPAPPAFGLGGKGGEQDPAAGDDRGDLTSTGPQRFLRRRGDDPRHLQEQQPAQEKDRQDGRRPGPPSCATHRGRPPRPPHPARPRRRRARVATGPTWGTDAQT